MTEQREGPRTEEHEGQSTTPTQSNPSPCQPEVNDAVGLAMTDRLAAQRFLTRFGRRRPMLSFACHRTRRFLTRQYDSPRAAAWAARWWCDDADRSVYFVGNSHRMDEVRKPSKEDIELGVGVWLDIDNGGWDEDVPWALRTLIDHDPTYIAFTGGGYQAHWRFDEYTDGQTCEQINLWLIEQAKGLPGLDRNCWTCDHVWRLPGTRNRKPDREDALVHLVHEDWQARLPLAECGRAIAPTTAKAAVEFDVAHLDIETVRDCIGERAFHMLTNRPPHCPSRSEHEFAFIGSVLGEREPIDQCDIDLVAACMLARPVDEYSVSHRAHSRRDPERHVQRQISDWLAKNGREL